jgi:hypothetical protein
MNFENLGIKKVNVHIPIKMILLEIIIKTHGIPR